MSDTIQNDRILRRKEVEQFIGLSRSSIYEAMAQGEFPSLSVSASAPWAGGNRPSTHGLRSRRHETVRHLCVHASGHRG